MFSSPQEQKQDLRRALMPLKASQLVGPVTPSMDQWFGHPPGMLTTLAASPDPRSVP